VGTARTTPIPDRPLPTTATRTREAEATSELHRRGCALATPNRAPNPPKRSSIAACHATSELTTRIPHAASDRWRSAISCARRLLRQHVPRLYAPWRVVEPQLRTAGPAPRASGCDASPRTAGCETPTRERTCAYDTMHLVTLPARGAGGRDEACPYKIHVSYQ